MTQWPDILVVFLLGAAKAGPLLMTPFGKRAAIQLQAETSH